MGLNYICSGSTYDLSSAEYTTVSDKYMRLNYIGPTKVTLDSYTTTIRSTKQIGLATDASCSQYSPLRVKVSGQEYYIGRSTSKETTETSNYSTTSETTSYWTETSYTHSTSYTSTYKGASSGVPSNATSYSQYIASQSVASTFSTSYTSTRSGVSNGSNANMTNTVQYEAGYNTTSSQYTTNTSTVYSINHTKHSVTVPSSAYTYTESRTTSSTLGNSTTYTSIVYGTAASYATVSFSKTINEKNTYYANYSTITYAADDDAPTYYNSKFAKFYTTYSSSSTFYMYYYGTGITSQSRYVSRIANNPLTVSKAGTLVNTYEKYFTASRSSTYGTIYSTSYTSTLAGVSSATNSNMTKTVQYVASQSTLYTYSTTYTATNSGISSTTNSNMTATQRYEVSSESGSHYSTGSSSYNTSSTYTSSISTHNLV